MARPKVHRRRSSTKEIAKSLKRERPDLNPSDYLYLLLVQRLGRVLDTFDERHCRRDFGISGADMRILYALRRAGPPYALRPTQLFHSLLVTSGAITKQVDRLQAAGYVARCPGPANSGGLLIVLTAHGVGLVDRGLSTLVDWSTQVLTSLNRKEREMLCTLCDKMITDLEQQLDGYVDLGNVRGLPGIRDEAGRPTAQRGAELPRKLYSNKSYPEFALKGR